MIIQQENSGSQTNDIVSQSKYRNLIENGFGKNTVLFGDNINNENNNNIIKLKQAEVLKNNKSYNDLLLEKIKKDNEALLLQADIDKKKQQQIKAIKILSIIVITIGLIILIKKVL